VHFPFVEVSCNEHCGSVNPVGKGDGETFGGWSCFCKKRRQWYGFLKESDFILEGGNLFLECVDKGYFIGGVRRYHYRGGKELCICLGFVTLGGAGEGLSVFEAYEICRLGLKV